MKKLPCIFFTLVMASIMTVLMGAAMTFVVTLVHVGFSQEFLLMWWRGFSFAFPIALPLSIVVTPLVYKLTCLLVHKP